MRDLGSIPGLERSPGVGKDYPFQYLLEKTPESPLDCKEIKPPIVKGTSSEHSLEGLMLKLKLHLMQRTVSLGKTLKLGKIEGRRRRG